MFTYHNTLHGFLLDCESIKQAEDTYGNAKSAPVIMQMKKFADSYYKDTVDNDNRTGIEAGEIASWIATFGILKDVVSEMVRNNISAQIAMEYICDTAYEDAFNLHGNRRIDVIIAGANDCGDPVMFIIEMKQWSHGKNYKYFIDLEKNKLIFKHLLPEKDAWGNNKRDPNGNIIFTNIFKYESPTPIEQLNNYIKQLTGTNSKAEGIIFIPVVWLFNMDKNKTIENGTKRVVAEEVDKRINSPKNKVKVYFKGEGKDLTDLICNTLYHRNFLSEFKSGEPCATLNLQAEVEKILSGQMIKVKEKKDNKKVYDHIDYEINRDKKTLRLRGDQKYYLNKIIKDIGNGKEKIFVRGSAGSGKSVVALCLFKVLRDKKKKVVFVTPHKTQLKVYFPGQNGEIKGEEISNAYDIFNLEDIDEYEVIIVDEAQNIFDFGKDFDFEKKFCSKGIVKVFFYDEKQITMPKTHDFTKEKEYYHLNSQFRCNQEEGYLTFISDILYNETNFPFKAERLDFNVKLIKEEGDIKKLCEQMGNRITLCTTDVEKILDKTATQLRDIKGLEEDNVIVYIKGDDLWYNEENGTVEAKGNDPLIRNKYYVLLTRGKKSCYIYCDDKDLREYMHDSKGIPYYVPLE